MTVLSHQTIRRYCGGHRPLIIGSDPQQIRSASYDLRLGGEYYNGDDGALQPGSLTIRSLDVEQKTLEIKANQAVLVRTMENVALPKNLVGHLTLKLDILLKGLIMASQSQVDAGYEGPIFVLLYNLSTQAAHIQLGDSLVRIEFARLDRRTRKPYKGQWKPDSTLADAVRKPIISSLASLYETVSRVETSLQAEFQKRVKEMERRSTREIAIVVLTIVAILTSVYLTVAGPSFTAASDARAEVNAAEKAIDELQTRLEAQQVLIASLHARLASIERAVPIRSPLRRAKP